MKRGNRSWRWRQYWKKKIVGVVGGCSLNTDDADYVDWSVDWVEGSVVDTAVADYSPVEMIWA